MAESINALSYEKAINLLPSSFKPMTLLSKQQNIYASNNGKIILKQSKIHNSNQLWQSIRKEQLTDNNISYVCLIAGFLGMLVLPSEFLLDYFEKDNVTSVKNGRYNIRINIDGTKFILGESGRKKYDLTDFFISNSDKC